MCYVKITHLKRTLTQYQTDNNITVEMKVSGFVTSMQRTCQLCHQLLTQ